MSWVDARQFKIANRNGRHYVFRRNNAGNTEINIPKTITTKAEAVRWLKAHPDKVAKPNKFRGKRKPVAGGGAVKHLAYNPFNTSPSRWVPMFKPLPAINKPRGKAPDAYNPITPPLSPLDARNWTGSCETLKSGLVKKIGAGRQGVVFLARKYGKPAIVIKVCPRDLAAKARGEEQPVDIEYKIQSAVQKCSRNVVHVIKSIRCLNFVKPDDINSQNLQNSSKFDKSKQGLLIMEYCEGGDLASWIKTTSQLDDTMMYHLISDILGALWKIKTKYPFFSHNDLHIQNIFVAERGFLIGDFGWARLQKMGTNPAVNTANGTTTASNYGVGPSTDARYDHHLFLNELRDIALKSPSKFPKALEFLNKAVPFGYRGQDDIHVKQFRLKYGDPCPGLPTLASLFRLPFLRKKFVSSPELVRVMGRLRKTGRALTLVRNPSARRKTPSPKKASPKKKTFTNAQLVAMSRANLFKLSPPTRVRAIALRAKTKVASPPKKKAKTPSPVRTNKRPAVSRVILKSSKFEKLVEKIWRNTGNLSNNGWTSARNKALNIVRNKGLSLSPVVAARPHGVVKLAVLEHVRSPKSGRIKIRAPNSGRLVYADGASVSLAHLKNLARIVKANIKGLRSKTQIANKIFSKNK
jgi:serine/threonine protein kinase